ncbi:MAG TPA: hypothetical protein VN451_07830 [Chitinophagaceae bacterium]|nr:hypothetical protein [Chitinophagaceae bacterium]
MRFSSIYRICFAVFITFFILSCNKKEDFVTDQLKDYIPLIPGKYISYRLDSMVFTNFGRNTEVHKYQVKDVVDALITDNLGRPSYRVFRFIRDSVDASSWTPAQPWSNSGTYFITPLFDQFELIENNLRFIKLHLPVTNAYNWKGNKYLPTDPYGPLFNFSNDDNMADWDYYYDGNTSSFSYKGNNYTDVRSIEEVNESFNVPITTPSAYAAKSRSVEKYSKNIGLVYREHELWEYQPNTGNPAGPYKTGFGITQWMIDHN